MIKPLADILDYGLVVVFCGINPSIKAAATGHRFMGHSNRFWRAVHLAGFSPTLIPAEQDQSFLQFGCGLTSAVARPTRRADELTRFDLAGAGDALRKKIELYEPKTIAFLGKAAYSAIVARREIAWGAQSEEFGGARVWILPDPSGLNRYTLAQLVDAYRALRVAAADDFKSFENADNAQKAKESIWEDLNRLRVASLSGTPRHLSSADTTRRKAQSRRATRGP